MQPSTKRTAWLGVGTLGLLLIWDATGWDLPLAHLAGSSTGFALRDDWLLSTVLHTGVRPLSWALVLLLCANVVWPLPALRDLPFARRVQLPASALLATGAVALLKQLSGTSCPWDLAAFGGVAHQLSHWHGWTATDGGSGHCFPAGHASSGFALIGGYFALRHHRQRLARLWLAAALAAGFLLGAAQQLRGAHFMSHTLWTAWLCGLVAWLSDPLFKGHPTDRPAD